MQKIHPLKDKIEYLDYWETNFWRDPTKLDLYLLQQEELEEWIKDNINKSDIVTTHDINGEYGHSDHILVHQAVVNAHQGKVKFSNAGKLKNNKTRRCIKQCYKDCGAWTWN